MAEMCVACSLTNEARPDSKTSLRPIPPRFRATSDTALPDAKLCARHFQWLLRHFQEDKAQPHLRCLKKPPKRCLDLLSGLAGVGVNLVQPSESSSAAAGRVKVTQYGGPCSRDAMALQLTIPCSRPCCRRGCMAVQRHPIPKDVLPSVSGARVCRGESPPLHPTHRAVAHHRRRCTACYMWLRRHFGLCSPQHQHCTESRVTPHCREMLDNFRANGVTFRKPAAGARQTPPLRVNSRAWGVSTRACWATERQRQV